MAGAREDREEVRAYVVALFERWRAAQESVRGDGIAEFARQANVPDGGLRVWLGRAGPKKRETVGVPSAAYLLRLIRAAESPVPAALPGAAPIGGVELAESLEDLADEVRSLRRILEHRLPESEGSSQSPSGHRQSALHR